MPYITIEEKSVYIPEEVWGRACKVGILMAIEPTEALVVWLSKKLGKGWAEKIQTFRDEDWKKLLKLKEVVE